MVILETIENKNLRPRVQSSSDGDSITSVASLISCLTMSLNSNIALEDALKDDEEGEGKEQQTHEKDSSIEEESDDDDEYDDSSDDSSEESDDSDESEANNNFMIPVVSSPKYELLSSLSKMFMEPKELSQAAAATEQQTRHTNNINNNNFNDTMKRPYNTHPEDDDKKHTNRSKLIREQQQRRTARYINNRLSPPANLFMMGGLLNHHHPYDNNKYISPPPMRLSNSFGSIRFSPPTASSSQAQQARLSSSLPSFKTSSSSSTNNMSIHTNTNNYNSALKLPHYTNTLAVQQAQQAQAQAHHKRNLSDTRHSHSIKQKQEYYNINNTTDNNNNNNNTVDSSHSSSHSSNPQESDNANTTSTVIKQKPFTSTKTITKTATATATTTNKYNKSSNTKPPTNLLLLRRTESCPSFLPPSSQHHRRSSYHSQIAQTQDVEKNVLEEFELTLTPSQQNAKDLNAQGTSHFNNGSFIESLKSYGEALKVVKSEITTIHEGCEDDFFSEDEGEGDGSYHHVFNHHYYYSVESAILICTSLIGMGVVHWKNSKNNHYGGVPDSTTRDELSDAIHSLQEALFTLEKQKDYGSFFFNQESKKEMTISRRLFNTAANNAATHNIDEAAKMCLFLSCKISALMNLGIVHLLKVSKNINTNNINNLNDINITNNDNNLNVALDYFIQALDIQKQVDNFIFFYSSSHFSRINDINNDEDDDDSFKINNFTNNNNTFSRSFSYSNKVAILYDLIGKVYEMQGLTKKATNKFYQGLQIKQRHLKAMVTKRKKDSTSSSYNNIESYSYSLGLSYMNLGKLNLDMYLQQQQYDDSIRKYYTIGSNFNNKRNNIKQLLQSALNLYQKAYKLMTPTLPPPTTNNTTQEEVEARHQHPFNTTTSTTEAILAHQIGKCFFFLMDYENADLYYKRAERIFSSSSSRPLDGTAVAAATVGSSKVINSLWKDMAELKIKTWRNDIEKLNQKYHQFQQTNKKQQL